MTINGKRNFKYNGKQYQVVDLMKADRENGKKYAVAIVNENGFARLAYNIFGWELEKFSTIKEAQRYVRDWDFALDTF